MISSDELRPGDGNRPFAWMTLVLLLAAIICGVVYYYRSAPSDPAQYMEPAVEPVHTIDRGQTDPCTFTTDIASMASTHEVMFTLFNSQEYPYDVAWIDFQGNHRHYATVNPHTG